jgi:hypothetical protein
MLISDVLNQLSFIGASNDCRCFNKVILLQQANILSETVANQATIV